jgi:beta-glucanase (GH16 family)
VSSCDFNGRATHSARLGRGRPVLLWLLCAPLTCNAQSPSFYEDFSSGALDSTRWKVSNWHAPGSIPGKNTGVFSPAALDFSHGLLRISVMQSVDADGHVRSTGGEIQSRALFGYGTYEFVMRLASTADTPDGQGRVMSGSDSGAFTFVNNSETELDIEFLGSTPGSVWLTNWVNAAHNARNIKPTLYQQEQAPAAGLAEAFHTYRIDWSPGKVVWRLDDVVIATHLRHVPTTPAHLLVSHWGTNNEKWGGRATPGVPRYLYVRRVSFTPMAAG